MKPTGHLTLRDRTFEVKLATVISCGENWCIEIETQDEEFDGENWAPHLYHQGLRLAAGNVGELQGLGTSWQSETENPHPEIGAMYVYGHHVVRNCKIVFGEVADGLIQLSWEGLCDIFWDEKFNRDVPFRCECFAVALDA